MSFLDKREELADLKQFRSQIDDFPAGEVVPDEEPDFVILSPSVRIGVEHTRLFKSAGSDKYPAQAEESQRREVVSMARQLYELRALPPLRVSIFFGRLQFMNSSERFEFARAIANCVVQNLPQAESQTRVEWAPDRSNGLPGKVDHINIHRREIQRVGRWYDPQAGFVLEDARDLIQEAISKKAKRYSDYMKKVGECWLLLVADGMKPSSMIRPDEEAIAAQYVSPFARTYFMRCVDPTIIQLSTEAPLLNADKGPAV